jgi:hypothetical protein
VTDWVDQLPFKNSDTIVAFGDSATDDLQGWFEIFKNMLEYYGSGSRLQLYQCWYFKQYHQRSTAQNAPGCPEFMNPTG